MSDDKDDKKVVRIDGGGGLGERYVNMSNALTRAAQGLTLAEKRVVASAVSKIDSRKRLSLGEVLRTRITAAEFVETFGVDSNTAYEQLQSAAKNLYTRSIQFYEAAYKRNGKPLPPTVVTMRWVGSVKYQKGEGWVELAWWPELQPHLTGLRRQFTSYQLEQASALRSMYSWRLLELLQRFKGTGWAEYTVEDFAHSMEAPDNYREVFSALRRRIIEPAVKELNEKDGWKIEWSPVKAGRRIKALRFRFAKDPQGRLDL